MQAVKWRNGVVIKVNRADHYQQILLTCIDGLIKHTRQPTDLINRDFGTLSNLCEGELSVVCRTSERHLEGKETFQVI